MTSPVIKIKRSSVQNNAPTAAQLELGELALNTYDGKLFTEINDGTVSIVEIGGHLRHLEVSGITTLTGNVTVGNYSFPSTIGAEDTVLKVDSGGNLVFGAGSSGGVIPTEKTFTATQGQTVFTDTSTLPTYIQVFVNGVKIRPTTDFSKSGSSITLVSAATVGDEIDLVRFD